MQVESRETNVVTNIRNSLTFFVQQRILAVRTHVTMVATVLAMVKSIMSVNVEEDIPD